MKLEGRLFAVLGVFLLISTVIYWGFSKDPTGTSALALSAGLGALIAFYLLFTARRIDARPEDDEMAEVSDGAGELGFFSPHSWWPLAAALAGMMTFSGVVFGWWLVILAVPVVTYAVIGFVFEYYKGEHAH